MERKNKAVLSALIAAVMVIAVLASFGMNFFPGSQAEIVLPSTAPVEEGQGEDDPGTGGNYLPVEVTPETVKDVVATLDRPESYYRTLVVETAIDETRSGRFQLQVWQDGDWTMVELDQAFQPLGTQHTILHMEGERGTLYRWYEESSRVASWPVEGDLSDLIQYLPTYEDVLDLEQEQIVAAGFQERDGMPCVYVETSEDELGYLERYWVSTDTGALVGYETVKDGTVVQQMTALDTDMQYPLQSADLSLPDGTVLHTVGEDLV